MRKFVYNWLEGNIGGQSKNFETNWLNFMTVLNFQAMFQLMNFVRLVIRLRLPQVN